MDSLKSFAPLAARVLIGVLFLLSGLGKLGDVAGFSGYLASGGLPAFLAWPSILFEIALGASMLIGFQARIMGLLGAGFCVLAALLYHYNPADQMQMMIFAHGAGKLAIDKD